MLSIWVLNLDRSSERWKALLQQAHQQQLELNRWSATDGAVVGLDKLINQGIVSIRADFLGLRNAPAIAGLCHSSFSLWNHLLSTQDEWFLILEDDVVLPDKFTELVEQAWPRLPSDAEAVLFGCDFWQRASANLDAQRFHQSIQAHQLPFWKIVNRVGGAFAYAVNRAGLAKLLSHVPFQQAVDHFPYSLNCYLLAFHSEPHYSDGMAFYGVIKCSGAQSTVQL